MTTDYEQLLRGVYKEFHQGGRYYKGKGADFMSWMLEHHPEAFYIHIERADGGRQVHGSSLESIQILMPYLTCDVLLIGSRL